MLRQYFGLALCGMASLYWELVLIRWLGACLRIVAYFTNCVLIAAFFGLGVGALLTRFRIELNRWIFLALSICILAGAYLGKYGSMNPSDAGEFVWIGTPPGVVAGEGELPLLPLWLVLGSVYLLCALVFAIFGQWLGNLFRGLPPLSAYSVEIMGSVLGILLFASMSFFQLSPVAWFATGFMLLAVIWIGNSARGWLDYPVAAVSSTAVFVLVTPAVSPFIWSPYYKIRVDPIDRIQDVEKGTLPCHPPIGYSLTVNNDYHQMMLDLKKRPSEHPFLTNWRKLYDAPYARDQALPAGPILIVGAGTGNDVAAALRTTSREIYAVEIDPAILGLGRALHAEHPYDNPRVHVVVDDARSFFHNTQRQFAAVVFGFLDSHTLLTSFSSVRLDNFVYTKEAMEQVMRLLVPGGEVCVTFASNRPWIHRRILSLLNQVFDGETILVYPDPPGYANGIVYLNFKSPLPSFAPAKTMAQAAGALPTDDWPFLYLEKPVIPTHYWFFVTLAVGMGFLALLVLPRSERRVRLPYFFMGAAFFLIETSNIVSLSLLYGSTWVVNIMVFTGILLLVLTGNLASTRLRISQLPAIMAVLGASIGVAYAVPTSQLLHFDSWALRAIVGVLFFLGPVFFASLVFALMIRDENNLAQAYGSNILGAVVGGAMEYLSLIFGFKFLLGVTLAFYLITFLLLYRQGSIMSDRVSANA
jgi:SAM-dependent methyltransferase